MADTNTQTVECTWCHGAAVSDIDGKPICLECLNELSEREADFRPDRVPKDLHLRLPMRK